MQYRNFGTLNWRVSALGFGCMRLPVIDNNPARVDQEEATQMIRHAIDHGVNYVDTAYTYHGGTGEAVVGQALKDGYRQRIRLATKMPSWLVKEAGDFDRYLEEQLERLRTYYLDFYLLHSLDAERWHQLRDLGVLDWAERQMAAGLIHHLGFSFHDTYPAFQEIVDAYDNWTLAQIYYNFLSQDRQAGTQGLRYAARRGLATVIMGPVGGGLLSTAPPPAIQQLWASVPGRHTPAERALRWVWNHPEVSVVLSGMSTMQQLAENLATVEVATPGSLSEAELESIARVRATYEAIQPIPCTECKYCQPCPNGVNIPDVFNTYGLAVVHGLVDRARNWYRGMVSGGHGADQCLQCGECEAVCPQKINIMEWLSTAHAYLAAD